MRRILALLILACAPTAYAQHPLTGTWEGSTRGGATIVLDFSVKDTALTGTLTRDGQKNALSDGKVTKTSFTFKATLNERNESFSGTVEKDEIRVWLDRQGPDTAIVLRRAKSGAK